MATRKITITRPYEVGSPYDKRNNNCIWALYFNFCETYEVNSLFVVNFLNSGKKKMTADTRRKRIRIAEAEGIVYPKWKAKRTGWQMANFLYFDLADMGEFELAETVELIRKYYAMAVKCKYAKTRYKRQNTK